MVLLTIDSSYQYIFLVIVCFSLHSGNCFAIADGIFHECVSDCRSSTVDMSKKRPLIVFDGSSTSTSIKVRKTENGDNDRLKPPSQASFTSNAFRKVSSSSSSVSPLILSSNLPMNNKTEHNNNDTKQNHDLAHGKSPLGPAKLPPLSPVGTTPVKLKRAARREEAETVVSGGFHAHGRGTRSLSSHCCKLVLSPHVICQTFTSHFS